jgi:hypothetical protein
MNSNYNQSTPIRNINFEEDLQENTISEASPVNFLANLISENTVSESESEEEEIDLEEESQLSTQPAQPQSIDPFFILKDITNYEHDYDRDNISIHQFEIDTFNENQLLKHKRERFTEDSEELKSIFHKRCLQLKKCCMTYECPMITDEIITFLDEEKFQMEHEFCLPAKCISDSILCPLNYKLNNF